MWARDNEEFVVIWRSRRGRQLANIAENILLIELCSTVTERLNGIVLVHQSILKGIVGQFRIRLQIHLFQEACSMGADGIDAQR